MTQVKPLDFKNDEYGNKFALTSYGTYWVYAPDNAYSGWLLVTACGSEDESNSEQRAIEIAQGIHKAKILECLINEESL